ncbi:hypothetical protein [Caulobacter sp. 17J65-9]|uniref:hypothetical protein n=1 Tax=Caulobacter sp. 17J65-9 TaxID=2709382 RepID=UPI0013C8E181|nr:hypothetical protein [Caulobacter sp. 17J65-9]NEX95101.1 hypothetical protein [Caulobacter sp. 17J65-9]
MSESVYFLTICLPLLTFLLIFAMRYGSAVLQARARFANDEAYRQLAAQSQAAQAESARALAGIETALADARTRLAAIEKVLKDVE